MRCDVLQVRSLFSSTVHDRGRQVRHARYIQPKAAVGHARHQLVQKGYLRDAGGCLTCGCRLAVLLQIRHVD